MECDEKEHIEARRLLLELAFLQHRTNRTCNQYFYRCEHYVCSFILMFLGLGGKMMEIEDMRKEIGGKQPNWYEDS